MRSELISRALEQSCPIDGLPTRLYRIKASVPMCISMAINRIALEALYHEDTIPFFNHYEPYDGEAWVVVI